MWVSLGGYIPIGLAVYLSFALSLCVYLCIPSIGIS